MGHRLSKIYTRTGDRGTTSLGDGRRVPKTSLRVEAYGMIDELNAVLGMVRAEMPNQSVDQVLLRVQHELFEFGAELATPSYSALKDEAVTQLEQDLDTVNADLPPLKEFILPGGGRAGAICHLARTVSRRAERQICRLAEVEPLRPTLLQYINRLSDLLFVLARRLARDSGAGEVLWQSHRLKKNS